MFPAYLSLTGSILFSVFTDVFRIIYLDDIVEGESKILLKWRMKIDPK